MDDKRWRSWLIVPLIAFGIFLLWTQVQGRATPQRADATEPATAVRTFLVKPTTVIPRSIGYGHVEPGQVWEAVAEVSGKIISINPRLEKGALLPAGTELLRIDPTDYELAIAQAEAEIQRIDAQFAESEVREANTQAALKIDQEALRVAERELQRLQTLASQNATSRNSVDQQQRTVLSQRQAVQNHRSTLQLIPTDRKLLAAQKTTAELQLASAQRDLERCVVQLPFAARISAVNVEIQQFAQIGKVLANVDGIEVAEVEAQIPLAQARRLIPVNATILSPLQEDFETVISSLGISAEVRLKVDEVRIANWPARLVRVSESVDPETRTRGFIVAVDKPYELMKVDVRPPLLRNTFVEVELRGQAMAEQIIVPRNALHGSSVYVLDEQQRLQIQPVTVNFQQEDFAVVTAGLEAGAQVVLSDVIPAVAGRLLMPTVDEDLQQVIYQQASAE